MNLRVAGIGAGRRAQAHYRALQEVENAEVIAICDLDEARAREAATPFGAETYADYRDMLDTEQPDAVYIITPPNLHAEQVEYAATQKAAIFVEKPVALSVLDARRIRMAVEQGGVLCCVGYQQRYGSLVTRARELLAGRELGLARIWWYQGVPKVPWNLDSAQGGGQIVEQATHLLDLCRLFGGEVDEVYAQFGRSAWKDDESFQNWDVYSGVPLPSRQAQSAAWLPRMRFSSACRRVQGSISLARRCCCALRRENSRRLGRMGPRRIRPKVLPLKCGWRGRS